MILHHQFINFFNEDGRCDAEIKSRIAMAKGYFFLQDEEDTNESEPGNEHPLCDVSPPRGAGGYAGVGGRTYCPPPQSLQRKRRPTAEESGSRRKARHSRRPPSERWGKGVAALDPTLNQTKAGALRGPACGALCWGWSGAWGGIGERQRGVLVADSLVGIHPHPGPTRRGVRSRGEGRRRRNEARREGRRRGGSRGERLGVGTGVGILGLMALLLVVTWNVRRLSVRETNRRRLRIVAERVRQERWEMVLLTELRADEEGVVWLGEDEERVVLIHGKKAGVMLRGEALEMWVEGGQQKWFGERVVAVVVGGLRLVSVYQPSWGADGEGMERCRRDMERQVAMGNRKRIVIGGDFNASIGRGGERRGVCGKYGLGRGNEAGRDLVDWCEEMGMAHVNSFMRYKRRGTWRHPATGRWHELDGFLVRGGERQRMVRRVWTRDERELSDHRPVCMRLNVELRRWRTEGRKERRVPRVRWEGLMNEEMRAEYEEKTRQKWESRGEQEWGWSEVADVLVKTVEEVCGLGNRGVASPWTVGRE